MNEYEDNTGLSIDPNMHSKSNYHTGTGADTNADTNTNSNAYTNGSAYTNGNAYTNADTNTNSNAYTNGNAYTNAGKSRHEIIQLSRHISQLIAFFLFPGLFLTLYNAIKDIVTAAVHGNFRFSGLSSQLLISLGILLITVLWGRFFCGYICSFGAMGDLIHAISKKILPVKKTIPDEIDRYLKWIKYFVLAFLVIGVWLTALPIAASISPWDTFGSLVSGNYKVAVSAITTIGFALLLVIIAGSFFIERFFCRYLCPLGAIFTPISKKRLFTIRKNAASCNSCSLCSKNCSMGIRLHDNDRIKSGECIDCMNCISSCPQECFHSNPAPAVAGTATAIAIAGLAVTGNIVPSVYAHSSLAASSDNSSSDNTYTESNPAHAHKGKHNNHTSGNFGGRFDPKRDKGFDGRKKGIDNTDNTTTNPSTEEKTTEENKSNDSSSTASPLEMTNIADGTYTGTGNGFRGTTKASVTVKDHKITDITIDSYSDDAEFFNRASSSVIEAILASQNLNVPAVSGATFSSNGILEAVANALQVTFDNPNQRNSGNGMQKGHI